MAEENERPTFLDLVRESGQRTYEQMGENVKKAVKQKAEEVSKQQEEAEPGKEFFDLFGRW